MATRRQPNDRRAARGQERTRETRRRIQEALADQLEHGGSADAITFKRVAKRARVTEMTVYRHFPTREALLTGLWEHLNERMGDGLTIPTSLAQLLAQHTPLYRGFDRIPSLVTASLVTEQGRDMRNALNAARQDAFLAIAEEAAPRRGAKARRSLAAVLQLLHGAPAWLSLREQWGLDGPTAAAATRWAIDALLDAARRESTTT